LASADAGAKMRIGNRSLLVLPNREIFALTNEVGIRHPDDLRRMQIGPHEFIWT
jgi:hypothetical protein